jgi:hypothetical protein
MTPGAAGAVVQTSAAAKARTRRLWLILAGISIGWKLLVLSLGAAIPKWVVGDGTSHLPAADRPYAAEAKRTALALWNNPIERHGIVRTVRVMSVDTRLVPEDAACGGQSARVRAYTYFAIPYSEVRTACDRGVVEYRVFRRRWASTGSP